MTASGTPSFNRPPVIETMLGVQFDPLPMLTSGHLGMFWGTIAGDWPNVIDVLPIPLEFERFGDIAWNQMALMFSVNQTPKVRLQIKNRDGDRMIQIQNGRFHYNWLGQSGSEYVRYETILPEFRKMFDCLRAFISGQDLGKIRPNQWEVTYVNHLLKGDLWAGPEQWNEVFSTSVAFPFRIANSRLESFAGQWHYEIEQQRGRLHVALQHGRQDDAKKKPQELLIFKLTARGPVTEQDGWDLDNGIDLGHRTVVNGFKDLASLKARKLWEEQL